MKLFGKILLIGLSVLGALGLWSLAANLISDADSFSFGAGLVVALLLLAALVRIGFWLYATFRIPPTGGKSETL